MMIKVATAGLCFDVDEPMSAPQAEAFFKAGYLACGRYLPRTPALMKGNLTAVEIQILLTAGLSVFAVQHCPEPGWVPSGALGTLYGGYAAGYAKAIGLPAGMVLWDDLEMVADGTPAWAVVEYCNAWYCAVNAAGYRPGLYVGYGGILTPQELYGDLLFKNYWRAYNGPEVAIRGFQIVQETRQVLNGIAFDPNRSQLDELGDSAIWLSPD
jgi:Domain of unknown function (DUF1906)